MAFNTQTSGFWSFDGTLEDQVSNNDFVSSDLNVVYGTYQTRDIFDASIQTHQGLQFVADRTFDMGSNLDFDSSGNYIIVIRFWWTSPIALGQMRHTSTRLLTSVEAPILAMASTSTSGGIESVRAGRGEWIVTETGVSKTQNAIKLYLCGNNNNPTHIIQSEPYDPGLVNVYIAYESHATNGGIARIDIDGKTGTFYKGPSNIASTTENITINKSGFGYTAHKTTQTGGIMGELLVMKSGASTTGVRDSSKIMRLGWEYEAEAGNENKVASYMGFSYDQPPTIDTNQIFADGRNIFAMRTNGEILKGHQPIWDIEHDFTQEISGNLPISGDTVRI